MEYTIFQNKLSSYRHLPGTYRIYMNKGGKTMQKTIQSNGKIIFILKCLLCAYIITGGLLLLLAVLLYRFQLKESIVAVGITTIYIVASFLSGFITGKKVEKQKFLWGLLMGSCYFFVLIIISLLVNHTIRDVTMHFWSTLFICSGSGMLGGMFS